MSANAVPQPGVVSSVSRWRTAALLLLLVVPVCALILVHSTYRNRQMFVHLESLYADENRLQEEWRQLLLERSSLAAHARVERIAVTRLGMQSLGERAQVMLP